MILVPQEVVRNKNITNDEVLTYFFVQVLTYSPNYDSCIFRVSEVIDQAFGETKSHSLQNKVRKEIDGLIDKGALDIEVKDHQSLRIFMSSFQPNNEDHFIKVDAEDARDLVDNVSRGKSDVLRYYMLLISTFNKFGVGQFERRWFADIMNVKEDSISHYTNILENLKKIFVYRSADFYTSNTYGLYKNREAVTIAGEKRSRGRAAHANANEKRKYVSMYHYFLKGKDYPIETIKEILDYLTRRNKEVGNLGNRARGMTYDLQPLIDKING